MEQDLTAEFGCQATLCKHSLSNITHKRSKACQIQPTMISIAVQTDPIEREPVQVTCRCQAQEALDEDSEEDDTTSKNGLDPNYAPLDDTDYYSDDEDMEDEPPAAIEDCSSEFIVYMSHLLYLLQLVFCPKCCAT